MTFQVSNFFFLVSSPLQWSSGSNIRIFNLPEEEWGVLSQAINNLKSSPEVQLCSFRDIIQKIFIFDLEFIWIQFSTLSFTRFLPSPCLPREVSYPTPPSSSAEIDDCCLFREWIHFSDICCRAIIKQLVLNGAAMNWPV